MPNALVVKPLFKAPNRSPNGVGTNLKNDVKGQFGMPDPTKWTVDYCDFVAGDLAAKWAAVLAVGAGASAQLAGDGGLVTLINSAAGSDKTSLVKTATVGQNWTFDTTRGFIMEARFSTDDATNASIAVGMATTATDGFTYTDGFMILKPAAATSFKFEAQVGSSKTTSAVLGQPTTWVMPVTKQVTVGFAYKGITQSINGVVNFEFLVQVDLNDALGPRQQSIQMPATKFVANTVNLMPVIGVLNGTAAARTITVDYVMVAKEKFNN